MARTRPRKCPRCRLESWLFVSILQELLPSCLAMSSSSIYFLFDLARRCGGGWQLVQSHLAQARTHVHVLSCGTCLERGLASPGELIQNQTCQGPHTPARRARRARRARSATRLCTNLPGPSCLMALLAASLLPTLTPSIASNKLPWTCALYTADCDAQSGLSA